MNKHSATTKALGRMASGTAGRQLKPVLAIGSLILIAGPAAAQKMEPPPFDLINRHHVNMMSGTVAPRLVDVSIGGKYGLEHSVSTTNSEFINYKGGYGPIGPRDKYFGRAVVAIYHKPSTNPDTWTVVLRATSFEGTHDFTINAGCSMDGAGNVLSYNTFTSFDGDPRHLLEYTSDKNGLVWTKPDGTRIVFASGFAAPPKCFTSNWQQEGAGHGISRVEYANGFTISGDGTDIIRQIRTNTGFQLAYIYVNRPATDPYYGGAASTYPFAPEANDPNWGHSVPKYVVAINNAYDYCALSAAGDYASVAAACPGLTKTWPYATYDWPAGMPRVAYLPERTTTFTITDAMGGVTKYMHLPFPATLATGKSDPHEPRIYQIQEASSDVPDFTYKYETRVAGNLTPDGMPLYIAGPAALLKQSEQNITDTIGYSIGLPYGQGGMTVNGSGGRDGNLSVRTNHSFGPFYIELWDKTINFEQQKPNKLSSMYRKTDGVTLEYGYDARYNLTSIKENTVVTSTALYPTTCSEATRKTCNKPTWTKDAKGNQTDYEYDANSGEVKRIVMPANQAGIRPEIRYEYQPRYAYYKRSAAGAVQQADTPVYLLTKETRCNEAAMSPAGACTFESRDDTVTTEYDYGPATGVANNLLLRGVAVTAYADGAMQTRRTCYSYDIYGNRIGETKPQAGLTSCN